MTDYYNGELSNIIGKTMKSVTKNGVDSIDFVAETGERWQMYYEQDCCASCTIEDVVGDLEDLVGSPISMAEAVTSASGSPNAPGPSPSDKYPDSYTWTFYKLATAKGYVTIRWYGSSNGYYSETASFRKVK